MTINGTTTNYVYDGFNPVQEKSGGAVTANLITGLNIDEFFQRTDGVGSRALLTDALGSTVALGDGTGTLQTQYTYEPPFGYATQTGQSSTNSYKYTSREDDGSGLYYYRARYYHPRLQRFVAEDPIGYNSGDFNLYGYVRENLLYNTDPFGNCPWCIAAAVGAVSGAAFDLLHQGLINGQDLRCLDLESIGYSALWGAGLSTLGPTGALLGRGGPRAMPFGYNSSPGFFNGFRSRFGWSGPVGSDSMDVLSARIGRKHYDFRWAGGIPSGANPFRDGTVSGLIGSFINASGSSCGCVKQ